MDPTNKAAIEGRPWAEVVAAKRAIRDAHVGKHELVNKGSGTDTLGADVVDVEALLDLLRSGKVSAQELIRAYIGR